MGMEFTGDINKDITQANNIAARDGGNVNKSQASDFRKLADEADKAGDFTLASDLRADADKHNSKGANFNGELNPDVSGALKQGSVGDCGTLSAIKGITNTPDGEKLLQDSVTANKDGSFDVKLKGDPNNTYHVSADDAKNSKLLGDGSLETRALACAADQSLKKSGTATGVEGVSPDQVRQLLEGKSSTDKSLSCTNASSDDIKKFIQDHAPQNGNNKLLTVSGVPDGKTGDWNGGAADHEFDITNYDPKSGTVTYVNPWDTKTTHTINIDDMAKQSAGTTVGFGAHDFAPPPAAPSGSTDGTGKTGGSSGGNFGMDISGFLNSLPKGTSTGGAGLSTPSQGSDGNTGLDASGFQSSSPSGLMARPAFG